jgi:tetratricopeptide (TPR) repeat protein
MIRAAITLSFICVLCPVAASVHDVVSDVAKLLEARHHHEALALVTKVAASEEITPLTRASVLQLAAEFLEHDAGAFERALLLYERVLALPLPPESPLIQTAEGATRRLQALKREHSHVYRALADVARAPATKHDAAAMIRVLRSLAAENPDFPERDTMHYYLGLFLFLDQNYAESYRELRLAATQHDAPAIKLPNLPRLLDQAHKKWLWASARSIAWSFIGLFLLVAAGLFYVVHPWRWMGIRQWIFLLVLVLAWWAVFTLASRLIGAQAQEAIAQADGGVTQRFSRFGNPAAEAFEALFRYGLVGTLALGVLAIATAAFRLRVTVIVANTVAAFLLFASLMFVFYDRYGTRGSVSLAVEEPSLFDYVGAVVSYTTDEIEPFLLTNPTAFPNLNIANIHDPTVRDWLMNYLPRTHEEPTTHDSF